MSEIKLKPCPFCKSNTITVNCDMHTLSGTEYYVYQSWCECECDARGTLIEEYVSLNSSAGFYSIQKMYQRAIEAWNNRADSNG